MYAQTNECYCLVIANCKTMKTEELKYHLDSMMEISSRIKCLGELYSFASERLRYYQALNKHKGRVDLLSLVESVDENSDEIREVYMERQYWGYCKHLQECVHSLFRPFAQSRVGQCDFAFFHFFSLFPFNKIGEPAAPDAARIFCGKAAELYGLNAGVFPLKRRDFAACPARRFPLLFRMCRQRYE